MKTQVCFRCETEKPLIEFYKHPQMSNGHLGKCKDCTKLDSRINGRTKKSRERERKRNSLPERRKHISIISKRWRKNNPEKYKAQTKLNNALRDGKIYKPTRCEECGRKEKLHGHHEDYKRPLDVKWLSVICHGKRNPNFVGV